MVPVISAVLVRLSEDVWVKVNEVVVNPPAKTTHVPSKLASRPAIET
jgi:hypothetical protein